MVRPVVFGEELFFEVVMPSIYDAGLCRQAPKGVLGA